MTPAPIVKNQRKASVRLSNPSRFDRFEELRSTYLVRLGTIFQKDTAFGLLSHSYHRREYHTIRGSLRGEKHNEQQPMILLSPHRTTARAWTSHGEVSGQILDTPVCMCMSCSTCVTEM